MNNVPTSRVRAAPAAALRRETNVVWGERLESQVAQVLRSFGWTVETKDEACGFRSPPTLACPQGVPMTRLRPAESVPRCPACGGTFHAPRPHWRFCSFECRDRGPSGAVCPDATPTPDLRVSRGGHVRWVDAKRQAHWSSWRGVPQVDIRCDQGAGYRWLETVQLTPVHIIWAVGDADVPSEDLQLYSFPVTGLETVRQQSIEKFDGYWREESWYQVPQPLLTILPTIGGTNGER
jgi:hypothetical protein